LWHLKATDEKTRIHIKCHGPGTLADTVKASTKQDETVLPEYIFLLLLFRLLAEKDKIERKLNIQGEKKDD
jgi:hypothetical protein